MATVLDSLNAALHQLMDADPRVIVLGEDILDPYGGAFKVTKGLSSKYPERVLTTPIAEAAIVGLSSGLALRGLRPIAEVMFGDFLMLAGDQLVNHAAKFQWMYNDQVRVPLVVRAPMGARRGYGPTHSQSLEKHFLGVPGLWVVAAHVLGGPGVVAGDLLRQAVELEQPVVFVESKTCYGRAIVDRIPSMTATVISGAGTFPSVVLKHDDGDAADGLLWCYGGMVPVCLEAVQQLREAEGLRINLAVPSQLSPSPVTHVQQIVAEAGTGLHVYAEEASTEHGWSAELLALVDRFGGGAALTHVRVGASHTPIPSGRELERHSLPQASDIVTRVLEHL